MNPNEFSSKGILAMSIKKKYLTKSIHYLFK